jgi:hypothetical protein
MKATLLVLAVLLSVILTAVLAPPGSWWAYAPLPVFLGAAFLLAPPHRPSRR